MSVRVPTETLRPGFTERVPARTVRTYEIGPLRGSDAGWIVDEAMDREMLEKLRGLGYVD